MTAQPNRTADTELLTPGAVAAVLFVDPKTVTRWARAGKIDSIRTPGGHRRYRRSDVEALAARPEPDEPPTDGLAAQSPGPPRDEWHLRHLHAAVRSPGPESAATMAEAVALTLEQEAATSVQAMWRAKGELESAVLAAHQATARAHQARDRADAEAAVETGRRASFRGDAPQVPRQR